MKKWIGVALIAIMFLSSIAFAFIQAFGVTQPAQTAQGGPGQGQLPADLIIDYRMSQTQMTQAVSTGFTVATYWYSRDCVECIDERGFLEQVIRSKEFAGQVILEEVVSDGPSKLEATSFIGTRNLDKIEQNGVVSMFCELVANPPLGCAVNQMGAQ